MSTATNLYGPSPRRLRHFLLSQGRLKTAICGRNPSAESMQSAKELASLYGVRGENLALVRRAAKGRYLRVDELRPSELQKHVFMIRNINHPAMQCIQQANERGEPVRALVFGAEMGADAFFMSKKLHFRASHGVKVTAVDIDPNALKLMKMTKESEMERLKREDISFPDTPNSAVAARNRAEWLAALESTTIFNGDADAALSRVRSDELIHFATASATFSYIPELGSTLHKLSKAMREGGVLVFDVYGDTHQKLDKPLNLYSQQQIRTLLDDAGFKVVHVHENAAADSAFHIIYVAATKRGERRESTGI